MILKFSVLSLLLILLVTAKASEPNACDDLEEAGNSTSEQIASCRTRIGTSNYYLEKKNKEELKRKSYETSQVKSETDKAKKNDNIETKKFSYDELIAAGFGLPFFAFTDDYRYGRFEQTRVTAGNSLCSYLKYEKASAYSISPIVNQEDSNKKGFIIGVGFFGKVEDPTMYKQDDPKVGVRKYLSITCVRRKDKKPDTSDDLKSIFEILEESPISPITPSVEGTSQIVDDKRESKRVTTPHGYVREQNKTTATPK
jgi:hypothetical protein